MSNKNILNQVLIVGRMNVGKSTLFNRLSNNIKSITLDYEGVTRDFIKDQISWRDSIFTIIDSGGINLKNKKDEIIKKVNNQVLSLINLSSVILFLVDGKVGLTNEDLEISKIIGKNRQSVILVINKIDSKDSNYNLYEFNKLGFSNIITISAEHGTNINNLLDKIVELLPKKNQHRENDSLYKIVLIGKPNVGKSSLMNILLKEERAIVSDIAGTTRESFSEKINFYKSSIELFDTPGIRKKSSISDNIENLMIKSSFRALKNADIILLVLDGSNNYMLDQDLKLAFYAYKEQNKSLIIIINKEDLISKEIRKEFNDSLKLYKHLDENVEKLEISCKTGKNTGKILTVIDKVWQRYNYQFDDAEITKLLILALQKKPIFKAQQEIKLYYVKQISSKPPLIELGINLPKFVDDSIINFFDNILRKNYNLKSVPLKFIIKKSTN